MTNFHIWDMKITPKILLPRSGATPEDYAALTPAQQEAIMEGAMNGASGVGCGIWRWKIGGWMAEIGGFMVNIWRVYEEI